MREDKREENVSIVIVTFNALNYVSMCLESVLANTDPKHEIIIVDNASDQPTRDYILSLQLHPNIKLILNDENRLWSPANNQGLKKCATNSRFCLLLNSDVKILRPDWLLELQKPMKKYEKIGITGSQYNFIHIKPTYGAIDGCCFMLRKKLLEEVGFLDEKYPWNGAGYIYTVNAWAKGWYYYFVNNKKILVHFGKRSRISNQILLKNQKVDSFQVITEAGLKPGNDYIAYLLNSFNLFNINNKLRKYYS